MNIKLNTFISLVSKKNRLKIQANIMLGMTHIYMLNIYFSKNRFKNRNYRCQQKRIGLKYQN